MAVIQRDMTNEPIDSNGNEVGVYRDNDQVQTLLDIDEFDVVGVDGRGVVVFGREDTCEVVYIRLDFDAKFVEHLQRKDMFGCSRVNHVREVANRFDEWRWVPQTLLDCI